MRAKIHDLMRMNVGAARGARRLIVVSSCLSSHPILERVVRDGDFVVDVCPETFHPAMISYRLLCVLTYSGLEELVVVTRDGSPYCTTLHFIAEEISRKLKPGVSVAHFVVEAGELHEISQDSVKLARHLSRLERLRKRLSERER